MYYQYYYAVVNKETSERALQCCSRSADGMYSRPLYCRQSFCQGLHVSAESGLNYC